MSAAAASPKAAGTASKQDEKKLIEQHMLLLLHAQKCRKQPNQVNGVMRPCMFPHCRVMKNVFIHLAACRAGKWCTVPHCSSSRLIIAHWKACAVKDCPMCLPYKEAIDRGEEIEFPKTMEQPQLEENFMKKQQVIEGFLEKHLDSAKQKTFDAEQEPS